MEFYIYFLILLLCLFLFSKFDRLTFTVSMLLFMVMIVFVSGFRYGIGTDYENYRGIYKWISSDTYPYMEFGYKYLNIFFKELGLPYEFSVFIFSLVINILIYRFIIKYSISPMISLILYVFLNYYFIAFNAVRQMMAIAIFLNGVEYVLKKKYLKFIMVVLLAALFHYTILIAVIYPLFKIKKQYIFIFFWMFSLIFIVVPIQTIIIKILPSSFKYAGYFTSRFFEKTSSLSIFKMVVPNVFVLLSFYYIKLFKSDDDRFWLNLFIFSIGIGNIANGVNLLIRLNYVFQISEIIFYPLFISKIKYSRRLSFSFFVFCYFILFYILTVIIQGAQWIISYQSILFL